MDVIPKANIQLASEGLRAIAHEVRLGVLCPLMAGPMCVNELIEATGASQSNLSQHLAKMRMMGIISNEKRGQQVFYRITNPEFEELVHVLKHIYCPEACRSAEEKA